MQGAEDELDWISRSGPTDTPNTGPAWDHTNGKGQLKPIVEYHTYNISERKILKLNNETKCNLLQTFNWC